MLIKIETLFKLFITIRFDISFRYFLTFFLSHDSVLIKPVNFKMKMIEKKTVD